MKTPVWQMIREATSSIQSDVFSMSDIIDSVRKLYGNVNTGTIRTQVNICTVNLKGRASMPENSKPRIADGKYDFLFSVGRGQFTLYDPQKHGVWELVDRAGKMTVAKKTARKSTSKTPVWQMIREAVDALDSEVITVADIIDLVKSRYGSVNEGTIRAQALACTVNRQSRVHMPENHKSRIANGQYDFLFSVGHGKVVKYIPAKHGVWEIAEEDGKRIVKMVISSALPSEPVKAPETVVLKQRKAKNKRPDIESPTRDAVLFYNKAWDDLESYRAQESALNKLFHEFCPDNKHLDNVLLKTTALNAFYATNIYFEYAVAKHIVSLDIDERINRGDITLVTDIASGHGVKNKRTGKEICFYSFATKYCSHHRPLLFPIYDSYVDKLLTHLRDVDHFAEFNNDELRDAERFKEIVLKLRDFYNLNEFSLKQVDRYLWQYGKKMFS